MANARFDDEVTALKEAGVQAYNFFDEAGAGVCLIWHITYEPGLSGLEAGNNVEDITCLKSDQQFFVSIFARCLSSCF